MNKPVLIRKNSNYTVHTLYIKVYTCSLSEIYNNLIDIFPDFHRNELNRIIRQNVNLFLLKLVLFAKNE